MSKDSKSVKLNQIIQNFYTKAAQVIVQSRIPVNPVYARGSTAPKLNKWFNLELEETDAFREELRLWRNSDAFDGPIPPLVVETFLDARDLNPHQSLVLNEGKEWNVFAKDRPTEVVLERWIVEFSQEASNNTEQDLPVVYKKCIILFRALYTHCRLLPSWNLRRKLNRSKLNVSPISVGCRVLNGALPISSKGRIGLTKPIADRQPHLETFTFGNVTTPIGSLRISVSYRLSTDFKVSDSEALLSSHFLHLDEQGRKLSAGSVKSEGSSSSSAAATTAGGVGASAADAAAATGIPTSTSGSTGSSSATTRPSIQPFKSPSLSASPDGAVGSATGAAAAGSRPQSVSRLSSNSSLAALRQPKSSSSQSSRYSSSFGSRNQWPRSGSFSRSSRPQSFVESSSVGSDRSLSPGSGLYVDDDDLGNFVKMVDSAKLKKMSESSSSGSASYSNEESKNPLAKFQLLRGNHAALSDSLQSSVYAAPALPLSSSPMRNHLPLVPSRLSEEYTAREGSSSAIDPDDSMDDDLLFAMSDMHIDS